MKFYKMCLVILLIAGLAACKEKGPAAKAGERVDEVVDNIKHGDAPLKDKGVIEKAGESIEDATKKK